MLWWWRACHTISSVVDPITLGFIALAVSLPLSIAACGLAAYTWAISRGNAVAQVERRLSTVLESAAQAVTAIGERMGSQEIRYNGLATEVHEEYERALTERRRAAAQLGVIHRAENEVQASGEEEPKTRQDMLRLVAQRLGA